MKKKKEEMEYKDIKVISEKALVNALAEAKAEAEVAKEVKVETEAKAKVEAKATTLKVFGYSK